VKALCQVFVLFLLSSCVTGHYTRYSQDEPVQEKDLARLETGKSGLGACLATLGAPTRVWEANGDTIAMAYSWLDQGDWGVTASYSITQFTPIRFSYGSSKSMSQGVVLIFDQDLLLVSMERGLLSQIVN